MATNSLDAVLSQYEKAQQTGNFTPKMSQEDRMKRYFAAILEKNEKQGQKRLRILPTADGSSPFVEAMFHEMLIDGKYIKLYDPAMDNERSPLNEVYEELLIEGDKKLASEYKSRKFYIVKVIDRDNEQDGPKFWRFKHNYKNEGILDKIIPIWRNKGDITDPEKGRDLIIELSKSKTGNGKDYTTVQTIMYDDPTPVHDEADQAKAWVSDELTWLDVYSKKPVEYLESIARGEVPRWDSDKGGYVYGNDEDATTSIGGAKAPFVDTQADQEPDGDLPF